jgi:hypothetical protein
VSVFVLSEGVDVVRCDSVFIGNIGENSSDIRFMQRVMRANRVDAKNPGKINNIYLWATGIE